jgi:hypothetical protein
MMEAKRPEMVSHASSVPFRSEAVAVDLRASFDLTFTPLCLSLHGVHYRIMSGPVFMNVEESL